MGTRRFDPHDATVVLEYTGDGRSIAGVPARDLTVNDLCRIVHKQSLAAYDPREEDGVRPDPLKPDQTSIDALVEELLTRAFVRPKEQPPEAKPKGRAKSKKAPTPVTPPPAATEPAAPVEG